MNGISSIRHLAIAALLVFATTASGLQSMLFNLNSHCSCGAIVVDVSNTTAVSPACCDRSTRARDATACCSGGATPIGKCRCDPQALTCACGQRCGCANDSQKDTSLPAIPVSETREVVTPMLLCAAPFVGYPGRNETNRIAFPSPVAEHATLSSLETCVLLSRFRC